MKIPSAARRLKAKVARFDEILQRQSDITDRYLAGKWFRLWGYIPLYKSMERTAGMYEKVVNNGPYSDIATDVQLKIGRAREKQSNYPMAAKAYERAADRYNDRPKIAAEALYREGLAYHKESQTGEYDQGAAEKAIATFTDFMALFPNDPRVPETQKIIGALKTEQARGSFKIARFYEKYHKWKGALVYYNEVLLLDPDSAYAITARERIDTIKKTKLASAK